MTSKMVFVLSLLIGAIASLSCSQAQRTHGAATSKSLDSKDRWRLLSRVCDAVECYWWDNEGALPKNVANILPYLEERGYALDGSEQIRWTILPHPDDKRKGRLVVSLGQGKNSLRESFDVFVLPPKQVWGSFWRFKPGSDAFVLADSEENVADAIAEMAFDYRRDNGTWPSTLKAVTSHTFFDEVNSVGKKYGFNVGRPRRDGWLELLASSGKRYLYPPSGDDSATPPKILEPKLARVL